MSEKEFKRRLTAILNADVVGYSRLMQDDEEATIRTLTSYRNVITNLIFQYWDRILDLLGNNLLSDLQQ